ncbi:type II secretion system protein GspM [Thalassolituus sp.]|jgi:MSHA biogenesis protein MshJ|uniref:type II secretion system protein GspM n=1 Tax=Thalassolituus sp. TaxID=2030822 RepID=UPI002620D692|nr:hypothetical protein [uncultured Thalassolituus sp.]
MMWWQNPKVDNLLEKYRALNPRERKLAVITGHILVAGVYLLFIFGPMWNSSLTERRQANEIETNVLRMQAHLERLRNSPQLDPNEPVRDDIQKISAQKQTIDERIQGLTDTLVAPENMPEIFENMMTQDQRLKLISLKNIAGQNVAIDSEFSDVDLYRHGVEIRMQADYPSLLTYLRRLDSMNWKLYWQTLDYRIDEYPNGELLLEVFTLSTREEILSE